MAKKKKAEEHAGGHGWFVTFADLMGLMMSFFVMLVSFSNQDPKKLNIVAGSMRDAFGVQTQDPRYSGPVQETSESAGQEKNAGGAGKDGTATNTADRQFAMASASLRQALQDMPEITEISKNVIFEETPQGLNLEIIDQNGRSMFADGSKVPYERTRQLIEKLAAPLRATPLRLSIVGHTSTGLLPPRSDYNAFDLSADRANMVRQILEREGLPTSHIYSVSGKADSQPLFPDDPSLAANRRVTITLMRESPALPPGLKP